MPAIWRASSRAHSRRAAGFGECVLWQARPGGDVPLSLSLLGRRGATEPEVLVNVVGDSGRPLEQQCLLDRVRHACAQVAAQAAWVRINEDGLAKLAQRLATARLTPPPLDLSAHYVGTAEDTCAFFVTLGAINFGSGYFPSLRKLPGKSGYFTIATRLAERFRRRGPWSAEELAAITTKECVEVFGQEGAGPEAEELMSLFARALQELGLFVLEEYDGRLTALVADAGHRAERLVWLLQGMPMFRDVSPFGELSVPFLKRAQLLASDLALAFGGKGFGMFTDLDHLTTFADNVVPHVLRVEGVLEYHPQLAARIDAGEPIPAHSREEVEIRACAVHSVERVVDELRRMGRTVAPYQVDAVLWHMGHHPRYKSLPRHRSKTVAY